MKYSHIVAAIVLVAIVIILNAIHNIVPWIIIVVVIGLPSLFALVPFLEELNLPIGGSDLPFEEKREENNLAITPDEVLMTDEKGVAWINRRIKQIKPYRKLNLDHTSKDNIGLHTKTQTVMENGEKKMKFGIIGRPQGQNDRETVGYIVDLNNGWIEDYSGELHTAEDRLDPFNGKKRWMITTGYKQKVKEEIEDEKDGSGINIYQNPSSREGYEGGGA